MREIGTYFKSSFVDKRCCDDGKAEAGKTTAWRVKLDNVGCIVDGSGHNTGYAHVNSLQEYTIATGDPTGKEKPNLPSDPDYVADYLDTVSCPIYIPPPPPPEIQVSLSKSMGYNHDPYLQATITLPYAVSQNLTFKVQVGYGGSYGLPEETITIPAGQKSATGMAGGGYTDMSYTVRINSCNPASVDGKTIKFPNPV